MALPPEPSGVPGGPPLDVPRRTSPWSVVYETIAVLAGLYFVVGTVQATWLLGVSLFSTGVGVVALALRWRYRTFTLTEDRLLVDEGVLERRHRVIPFDRVQQVNLTQNLLYRPLDLVAVAVETAGEGGASSVQLRVLRRIDGEQLRDHILHRRAALARATSRSQGADTEADGPLSVSAPGRVASRPLGAMSVDDLVLAGVTHTGVFAAIAVYIFAVAPVLAVAWVGGQARPTAILGTAIVVLGGASVVGVVAVAVSVAVSVVRDWAWRLSEEGDDLRVERGLLQIRSQSWPRHRVQRITVVDNPVRRWMGRASLLLHTAAAPGGYQGTVMQVPLVRREELDDLLTVLMGPKWIVPPLRPRPNRARWRAVRRRALLLAVAVAVPVAWRPDVLWILIVWVGLAWPWGHVAHRRAGSAVTEDLVVFACGVLHHRMEMAPRDRLQSARTTTSPLQRRVRLATAQIDLAGTTWRGPLRLSVRHFDADAEVADQYRRGLARSPGRRADDRTTPTPVDSRVGDLD